MPSDVKVFGTLHVLHSKFPAVSGFGPEIKRHTDSKGIYDVVFYPNRKYRRVDRKVEELLHEGSNPCVRGERPAFKDEGRLDIYINIYYFYVNTVYFYCLLCICTNKYIVH